MSRPRGRQTLSLPQQQFALRQIYPHADCPIYRGVLTWRTTIQPSSLSRSYDVLLRYDGWRIPRVYVVRPSLREIADGGFAPERPLPHVYPEEGNPLCLFQGVEEWNPSKSIAYTTIPWISLWLMFFEIWVVTNTWEGSGAPYTAAPKAA